MGEHQSELAETQEEVYAPLELFEDLRSGLFRELELEKPEIDLYRRNLQRSFVDLLSKTLENPVIDSDLPAFARSELRKIRNLTVSVPSSVRAGILDAHLSDLTSRIDKALDLEKAKP